MTKGHHIPDDMIADIMLKLPSKSLLRFKIACKTWYSLISDPVFTHLYSKRASRTPTILYSPPPYSRSGLQLLDYNSSSFEYCCLSRPIKFPYCTYPNIVGSSCGLVCLASDYDFCENDFYIWNPLTRECRIIPNLSVYSVGYYFHGLGYESVANDFKLVVSMDRIRYNIFSLKENTWKTITCPFASEYYHPAAIQDKLHGITYWHSLAIVLNGVFYWVVAPINDDHEIVAFDAVKETFKKLQLPQHLPSYFRGANLLEHNGCLCLNFSNEIWMMKEYGVWVHLLTFKNSTRFNCFRLPVLCISTRSEVVFHTYEKFRMCGRKEEDKLDKQFAGRPRTYSPVLYVETLVSPDTDEYRRQVTADEMKKKKKLMYESILWYGWWTLVLVSFFYIVRQNLIY